jgi:hypothetical protein
LASDEHIQATLDRLLTGLRGPLEAAIRASSDKAAEEVRRQAQEQLTQLRAAAKKENDDTRTSAETQIAELKRMLEDIRRTAEQQIDTARKTLETEVAAVRARTDTELADAHRMAQSQVAEVQRSMDERVQGMTRDLDDARQQLERTRKDAEAAQKDAEAARNEAEVARRQIEAARADAEAARQDIEVTRLSAASTPAADSLSDDLRSLDEATSLSDVLERLAQAAVRHAQRAALLIVRSDRLRGWQMIGFTGRPTTGDVIDLSLEEAGIAADALRDGRAAEGTRLPAFAFDDVPRDAAALPVTVGGVVVAVLYADAISGPARARQWQDNLDVLVRYASRVLETVTVQQATGVRQVQPVARTSHITPARPLSGGSS